AVVALLAWLLFSVAKRISKKLTEEGIVEERVLTPLVFHYFGGGDIHYCWKQWFDHRRKSFIEIHWTSRHIAGNSQCHRTPGSEDRVTARADRPSHRAADHHSRGQGDQRYRTSNVKKFIVHDQWPPATR